MAKDIYHDIVRLALEKEDWTITDDPYKLKFEGVTYDIDLGAEKIIAAEKENIKIAVEIKTFGGPVLVTNFHAAVGKYLNYHIGLMEREPDRILYLAVPIVPYRRFFLLPIIQKTIAYYKIKLIVYNPYKKIIEQWIG